MGDFRREFLDAWNNHDGAALGRLMAPDGVYEDVTLAEVRTGPDAVREFLESMSSEFSSDYHFDEVSFQESGDRYASEWVLTGTHDGSSPMLQPTGKRFSIRGVSVGTRENGLIKLNRDYWDMAGFLGQIGAVPAPEAASAG